MSTWIGWAALLALLVAAGASDLRTRRIPNLLVTAGALLGLGLQATLPAGRGLFEPSAPGAIGIGAALLAMVVLLAVGMLLWRARLFGAGDAKLLAAVGPYVGLTGVLPVLLYTLLAGGVVALVASLWRHARQWPAGGRIAPTAPTAPTAPYPSGLAPSRLPYALAIAAGAVAHAGPGALAIALARAAPSG